MKKKLLIIAMLAILPAPSLFGWGMGGHDAITYIAESHLTNRAKKNIAKYLDDRSIVYYASWMDEYRETPEYGFSTRWHVGYVDGDFKNSDAVIPAGGDAVRELEKAIKRLENYKELDDSTVTVNLKFILHLVADMHCPGHITYPDSQWFNVKLMGKETSYHGVWDSGLLDASHKWGYQDYKHQLDRYSKKERKAMSAGAPREWFEESAVRCRVIYDWAGPGDELGKDFLNKAHWLPEHQIILAGYRLAKVLNDIFG